MKPTATSLMGDGRGKYLAVAWLAVVALLGASAPTLSRAESDASIAPDASTDTAKPAGLNGVGFLTKKTRFWLGRSQMLCFRADQAPENKRYFSFQADERYIHVLMPPV